MSEGTPPPPPSDNPYGSGGTPPPPPPSDSPYGSGGTPPPPPPSNQPPTGPGGYGASAPPPPPVSGAGGYDAVDAIKYGWAKFSKNPGPLVIGALIVLAIGILFSLLGQLVASAIFDTTPTATMNPETGQVTTEGGGVIAGIMANALVSFVGQVVSALAVAGLVKMAFDIVDGQQASVATMLQGWDKVQLLVASLIVALLTAVGFVLCILPGIVVAVFTAFTTAFVVDKKLGAVDAIKASVDLVKSNLSAVIVWILLAVVCVILGTLACLVGLLVAVPVILISQAYTVRALTGGQISPTV